MNPLLIFALTLILFDALSVTGCSLAPHPRLVHGLPRPNLGAGQAGAIGFGTLSNSNDVIDMSASVVYSRLARYRYQVVSALRNNQLSVDDAEQCQNFADSIRNQLDIARAKKQQTAIQIVSDRLDAGIRELAPHPRLGRGLPRTQENNDATPWVRGKPCSTNLGAGQAKP